MPHTFTEGGNWNMATGVKTITKLGDKETQRGKGRARGSGGALGQEKERGGGRYQ